MGVVPTLAQARNRRWWIAISAVLENLMFAAVILGWSSLLLMLKKEGFYSSLCVEGQENITNGNLSTAEWENKTGNTTEGDNFQNPTCVEQDEVLNRYFSIGSSLLSGVTVVLGVIMDRYGSRVMRLCGCLIFAMSCICFAVGSMDTENYSFLIAPAVCLNGMGGVVYVFTSFQIPNLFENIRSTMISLMIGSYSASAVMYMIFKAAYDAGAPFALLMMIHAGVALLTFINCYFNIPSEPIPGPDDITYAIKFHFQDLKFDHKISGQQFLSQTSTVGRRMSNVDAAPLESLVNLEEDNEGEDRGSFFRIVFSPCVLWSFLTMSLTQLRLIAYMGWLELYLKAASQKNDYSESEQESTVDFYTFLFGLLQINCFFMAPIIGTVMDWKLKNFANAAEKLSANGGPKSTQGASKNSRKIQVVTNLARAFFITNVLLMMFGCIILFEKFLPLQVVGFLMHTAIRTFLHSCMGGLYACMYHFSHFGKLTGLASFLSAMFILIQDPLFVLINSSLGGDPFWVNVGLLVLSISGFGLPCYLWRHKRALENMARHPEESHHEKSILEAIPEDAEVDASTELRKNGVVKNLAEIQEEPALHLSISAITF